MEARAAALRRGVNAGLRQIGATVYQFIESSLGFSVNTGCLFRAAEADALEAAAAAFRGSAEKAVSGRSFAVTGIRLFLRGTATSCARR